MVFQDPSSTSGFETHSTDARSIGERIKVARKSLGLSQADLAARIGVSQPAIANWESGVHDPRRLALAKLADVLEAPLDWLAAGGRSPIESDKHAAAAYIRRPLVHVPVISFKNAATLAADASVDPHAMAEDYIPVTAGSEKLFALFVADEAMNKAFPKDTLVVIDYADRLPSDGAFCLAMDGDAPLLRRWKTDPARLEPYSTDSAFETTDVKVRAQIIGCARVSIRFH